MGKRGPGAGRLRAAAKLTPTIADHSWNKPGMPQDEQVIAFLESLPIVSGLKAGETMELLDFQEQFVRAIYGDVDDLDRRRVRLAALSVARGNGKSALIAGLSLAHLLGPMQEPYGECYAAALDREQAGVLYRMVRAYIEASPWMAARVNIRDWHKDVTDEENQSIWRALPCDARKAHGLAPSFWVADEVAQWRSRELWDNLATGMGKRANALGITISTQAPRDQHFFSEMLDAEPNPTTYVQLHCAEEDCALDDRTAWAAANPALGAFLNKDQFKDASGRAMRSASFESAFRNLNLNQRVQAEERFIDMADWKSNGKKFDPSLLDGETCFGGLDLSSTRDLTSFALYFPDRGKLLAYHWVPADAVHERAAQDRVPYDIWAKDGWIETPPGRATDKLAVAMALVDAAKRYDLKTIAFDNWRFADLEKLLNDEGIELPLSDFRQGFKSYAPAMDAFEGALLTKQLQHNNNPVLTWQAGNLVIETDPAGNRKPAKHKSIDKIDGLVATIMAVGIAQTDVPAFEYEGDGPRWI